MTNSPYALVGPKLVDQGFSAIPVLPRTKRPGTRSHGQWHGDLDWTRFCDRLPTDLEIALWERYPDDAGVCIALGKASGGLVAIDVDTDRPEVQEAIASVLPESPVQKTGRKGYTAFYRARDAVQSCAFNIHGERALDLLAHGKQTILPPTIHPDTGKPYLWVTESTLEHVTPDQLPMLPDDIAERLGAALAPYGYYAPVERPATESDGGLWREINDVALEKLEAWVPQLGMDAKKRGGNWRGRAIWRDSDDHNIGFSPKGIKDFAHDKGMTAIDVVMAAHVGDVATAEKWLREKLGIKEPPPVVFRLKVKDRAPDVAAHGKESVCDGVLAGEGDPTANTSEALVTAPRDCPSSHPLDGVTLGKGVDWKRPDGILSDMADWILATSPYPNRPLAVAASAAVLSALCGRRLFTPTGAALNLYIACLGDTGVGKDRPLKSIPQILHACGYGQLHQTAKVFSLSGLETLITDVPVCVATADEIGPNLLAKISSKKASSHESVMKGFFQEMWSRQIGDTPYKLTRRGMDPKLRGDLQKKGLEIITEVCSPSFTLLGASTPEAFYEAMTNGNVKDGFMNRFLIARADPRPEDANDLEDEIPVPQGVIDGLQEIASTGTGNLGVLSYSGCKGLTSKERRIGWRSSAAKERLKAFRIEVLRVVDAKPLGHELLVRASEYALRLACLHAVSLYGPAGASVGEDSLEWGAAWALESARSMMDSAATMMARNDHEEKVNAVSAAVRGKGTMSRSELLRMCRHINGRELGMIIEQLIGAGIIHRAEVPGSKRPKTVYEWLG
jgi:Bifunctional DNA primase/polymerase, N-terminal